MGEMLGSGVVSVTFRGLSAERVVELARTAKLDGIEWGGDIHAPPTDPSRAAGIGRHTREAGLKVFSYGSYYRAGDQDERAPEFEPVLETALALQARIIRIWAGRRASDAADDGYRAGVVADVLRIADAAGREGLDLCFEYHTNTLTDTPESTERLLRETESAGIRTHWQPPRGLSPEVSLRSLTSVLPRLAHLHVFHWDDQTRDRLALAEGEDAWRRRLSLAATAPGEHAALLEFVADDSEDAFLRDAADLRRWIAELSGSDAAAGG